MSPHFFKTMNKEELIDEKINDEIHENEERESKAEIEAENMFDELDGVIVNELTEREEPFVKNYPPVFDSYFERGLLSKEEYLRGKKYGRL